MTLPLPFGVLGWWDRWQGNPHTPILTRSKLLKEWTRVQISQFKVTLDTHPTSHFTWDDNLAWKKFVRRSMLRVMHARCAVLLLFVLAS
ncbi:hypothetical protein BP422_15645 [Brevibacillus formosus]|uniref:Uncharacterized protein n=1 Tax=Brevibacillus formosus TaxID=54913 RepID=A0A220MIH3_9BACL|nr:hypothetical protein BP422_15645 [Brevibacillus formosus]